MRTEDDLREAIELLAGNNATSAALLDRLNFASARDQQSPLRRVLPPLVAVLAVLAVTVAGFAAFSRSRHGTSPDVGGKPHMPLEWKFSVGSVPGYIITRNNISRPSFPATDISEQATVTATGKGRTTGQINFDTVPGKRSRTADARTIHGVTYYFRAGRHVSRQGGLTPAQYADPWTAAGQDAFGPQLSWSYPNGSQFVVSGTFGFNPTTYTYNNTVARKTMTRIALAIRQGKRDPVTMPFGIRSLPGGLVPVGLTITPPERAGAEGTLAHSTPLSACLKYATPDQPSPEDPTESIMTACRTKVGSTPRESLASLSFTTGFIENFRVRRLPDGTLFAVGVGVGAKHPHAFSAAELRHIAQDTDITPDLANPSSWLTVP